MSQSPVTFRGESSRLLVRDPNSPKEGTIGPRGLCLVDWQTTVESGGDAEGKNGIWCRGGMVTRSTD